MKPAFLLPFVALTLLFSACGGEASLDPAAAVVAGKRIDFAEIDASLEAFKQSETYARLAQEQAQEIGNIEREFQQQQLTTLINRYVLEAEAAELGIEVTEGEVTERLDLIKADFPSEEEFQAAIAERGITEEQLDDLVRDAVREEKVREEITKGVGPSPEELEAFYQENIAEFTQYDLSHILVKDKDQALAERLLRQLRAAPKDKQAALFDKLAKKHSTDPSAAEGGSLGVSPASQFVPPFAKAVTELKEGAISEPVKTEFGHHLILLNEKQVVPFEQARPQIEQQLGGTETDTAFMEWLKARYAEAEIKVNPRYGEFDPEQRRVVDASAESVPGADEPQPGPSVPASPPPPPG